jgi:hypothetical protein
MPFIFYKTGLVWIKEKSVFHQWTGSAQWNSHPVGLNDRGTPPVSYPGRAPFKALVPPGAPRHPSQTMSPTATAST